MDNQEQPKKVLGNLTTVHFPMFNVDVEGKVDTGATTTSVDAQNIKINHDRGTVSFTSEVLSHNVITLKMASTQDVLSADGDGEPRPVVLFDVVVGGVHIKGVEVNLNDRGHMDAKLLVGQNVLKAGNFQVDVNKDEEPTGEPEIGDDAIVTPAERRGVTEQTEINQAIEVLRKKRVTIEEIFQYLTVEALNKVERLES